MMWLAVVLLLAGTFSPKSAFVPSPIAGSSSALQSPRQQDATKAQPKRVFSVPAGLQSKHVIVIPLSREIDNITASSVIRRIKVAEQAGADAIVIEIDSPGGEVGAVLDITSAIKSSTVPLTVAWVHDSAYSGAAITALACDHIITSDPSAMGDAFPIILGFEGVQQVPEELRVKVFPPLIAEVVDSARRNGYDEYLSQAIVMDGVELWQVENIETGQRICVDRNEYKLLFGTEPSTGKPRIQSGSRRLHSSARSHVSSPTPSDTPSAEDTQAQPTNQPTVKSNDDIDFKPAFDVGSELREAISTRLAERSHRPALTADDAGKWKLVEYVCDGNAPIVMGPDDMMDLGYAIEIVSNDEEMKQFFGAERVDRLDPEWTESLAAYLAILANPLIRAILIAIFLIGLMLELSAPGVGVPGLIAAAAAIAMLLPAILLGIASWWELAAMGLGIVLIALELFVIPGFGIPGIAGIILLFGGLVATFVGPGGGLIPASPAYRTELLYGFVYVVLAVAAASVAFYFLTKNSQRFPMFQKLVLASTVKSPVDQENSVDPLIDIMRPMKTTLPNVGATGVVVSPLRPYGKAEINGVVIEVVAATESADTGDAIRVVAIRGTRIEVERST